jgi:hypothetical protein
MKKVKFYSRRVGPGNKLLTEEIGQVVLEDGRITITPEDFSTWLRRHKGTRRIPLRIQDGKRFLDNLVRVFHNAYMYAVLEQSSGGANPGGAERT